MQIPVHGYDILAAAGIPAPYKAYAPPAGRPGRANHLPALPDGSSGPPLPRGAKYPISNRAVPHHPRKPHVPNAPFRSWPCPKALEPALPKKYCLNWPQNPRNSPFSATKPVPAPSRPKSKSLYTSMTSPPGRNRRPSDWKAKAGSGGQLTPATGGGNRCETTKTSPTGTGPAGEPTTPLLIRRFTRRSGGQRCGRGCASWPGSSPAPTCGGRRNGAEPPLPARRRYAITASEQFPKAAALSDSRELVLGPGGG